VLLKSSLADAVELNIIDAYKYTDQTNVAGVSESNKPGKGFISSTWRMRFKGMFAGSCSGVICLVISLGFSVD
jgi:hypothetical protein